MNPQMVLTAGREALELLLTVSLPVLLVVMTVGIVVSIFQAVTQIQETTLSFVPKLLAAVAVFLIAGPWMLTTLVDYLRRTIESIPTLAA
ncbi:flagellar biosynthesis protein FliQ [Curvibacter sp. RS43]|uniref:Flagellar biosynthetic protein FliQ n=1 Tax=Curvibacter microcysteis TaxID=3026419 RepID=A0ABT5MKV0_9BURK|nr:MULTISPECIES: flagellar biosynthesis protein FliQ [unclassified Curvibacter]MDD0811839.1 flagellar biosynthesis protein FliQ [Curvibacter sp. RS43]MDD0816604.1 flagellar biosynthesis protein FliQ [Curvibacter sp. HBC28]